MIVKIIRQSNSAPAASCGVFIKNKARVSITIHESFSDLLDELGEPEAKEDVDAVLKEMRTKRYYD